MGVIAVLGTFATLWGLFTNKSILLVFLFFVNLSGVYFSQGRASALALLAGFVLIGTYYVADRTGLIVITISGLVFSPVFLLMTFGLIPGFDLVQNINLNNRIPLWTAAYHAFMDRPLLGWGIGNVPDAMSPYISRPYLEGNDPHSSYIRMFTATGLIGGTVYIYILLNVLWIRL